MPSPNHRGKTNARPTAIDSVDLNNQIAVLADVHGNYTALTAVLDDIPSSVTDIICLGDIIGGGGQPRKCVETIREECTYVISGDTEHQLNDPEQPVLTTNEVYQDAILHAKETLSHDDLEWLLNRPKREIYNRDTLLCHSHPAEERSGTYINQSEIETIAPYFEQYTVTTIIYGHTHTQERFDMSYFSDHDGLLFNPGSVGFPRDRNTDAAYALFDPNTQTVAFQRVPYDLEEAAQHIQNSGLPTDFIEDLKNAT